MPFGTVKFELRSCRHNLFESWANRILAHPDMEKFLEDLVILRSINLVGFMDVERNPINLALLVSRWFISLHTFVAAWREFCLSLEDMVMLNGLTMFGNIHVVDILD